eukprot:1724464-Pyramimonas_sp.AAC.1
MKLFDMDEKGDNFKSQLHLDRYWSTSQPTNLQGWFDKGFNSKSTATSSQPSILTSRSRSTARPDTCQPKARQSCRSPLELVLMPLLRFA